MVARRTGSQASDTHFYGGLVDHQAVGMLIGLLSNNNLTGNNPPPFTLSRTALAAFSSHGDPRRNVSEECGYPNILTPHLLHQNYRRDPIANRATTVFAKECWQGQPIVYESEDPEESTDFERTWDSLGSQLSPEPDWCFQERGSLILSYLQRADEESGIGHYSVILFGIDDGKDLSEPVDGITESETMPEALARNQETGEYEYKPPPEKVTGIYRLTNNLYDSGKEPPSSKNLRKLLYLRCFTEVSAEIAEYESNWTSPRHGQPVMYRLTFNDQRNKQTSTSSSPPQKALKVHWTRVLHVSESGEVFSPPRQEAIYGRVYDLQKISGASGEGYWRSCFTGLAAETHPQFGTDVEVDEAGARDQMEQYFAGLQRQLLGVGISFKTLAPQVVDPTPQFNIAIDSICIQLGMPKRVFVGSERGELASSQDAKAWNDRIELRRQNYITPRIIRPFVNRLIWLGVLPPPKIKPMQKGTQKNRDSQDQGGFRVWWPELEAYSEEEKAKIALTRTQAIVAYATSDAKTAMAPEDFWTRIMGFTEEEAQEIINNAESFMTEYEGLFPGEPEPEPPVLTLPSPNGKNGNALDDVPSPNSDNNKDKKLDKQGRNAVAQVRK